MQRMRLVSVIAVLLLVVAGCGDELRGPKVVVANHSGHTLSRVTLSGSGFTTDMGRIDPRSVESVLVHPIGESSIRVTFEVDGAPHDSGECCYFENNPQYSIAVDIDRDLKIVVLAKLEKY